MEIFLVLFSLGWFFLFWFIVFKIAQSSFYKAKAGDSE